jgi:hypothetical protein
VGKENYYASYEEILNKLKFDDVEKFIVSKVSNILHLYEGITDPKLIKYIATLQIEHSNYRAPLRCILR